MASFTALNVEPTAEVEVEVDNSKEIQVEEALKLYQNALKLHAQGPAYYEEAEDAYDTLFASEIFSYTESRSEAKRLAQLKDFDEIDIAEEDVLEAVLPPTGAETAPNTLPQLLYLSYKNHGQFLVDRIAHHIAIERNSNPDFVFENDKDAREAAKESLDFFVEALDKDETDTDLWRRTARVSRLLGSRRILRFCLEAALQNGDLGETISNDIGSLEGAFARAELSSVLAETEDDLSMQQLHSILRPEEKLNGWLTKSLDPFPKLPQPSLDQVPAKGPSQTVVQLSVQERSWQSLGKSILSRKKQDDRNQARQWRNGCQVNLPNRRQTSYDDGETKSPQKLVAAESLIKKREDGNSSAAEIHVKERDNENDDFEQPDRGIQAPHGDQEAGETQETSNGGTNETIGEKEEAIVDSPVAENPENSIPPVTPASEKRPSLKRNSESAGLNDGVDGGRSRSKRLRARAETSATVEEEVNPKELSKHLEAQLESYAQADLWLFRVPEVLCSKIGVKNRYDIETLRQLFHQEQQDKDHASTDLLPTAFTDFKDALFSWNLNSSNLLLHGRGSGASVTLIGTADDSGLASFLEHSKPSAKSRSIDQLVLDGDGLDEIVESIRKQCTDIDQVALLWLEGLLCPRNLSEPRLSSRYSSFVWPATLKEVVLQMIVEEDTSLMNLLASLLNDREAEIFDAQFLPTSNSNAALMQLSQTIFELHLDVYGQMTGASSTVDQPTRSSQKDRTRRWAALANQALSAFVEVQSQDVILRTLALRHLWSMVMYISLTEPSSREHVLLCLRDLRQLLESQDSPVITLPNSSIMPEISVEAAGREVTRLTTMDFFLGVFDPTTEDPVTTIESLEPILMETARQAEQADLSADGMRADEAKDGQETSSLAVEDVELPQTQVSRSQQLSDFLGKASASLRLSLWHRLRTAYEDIEYPAMTVFCNFRSMQIILRELRSAKHSKEAREDRTANLLVWIRNLSDLLTYTLDICKGSIESLECLDEQNLPLALETCLEVIDLLHLFALWEDGVRIGQHHVPLQASGGANAYKSAMNHLRDLQPKCWTMLYMLCKEAANQNQKIRAVANEDLAELLAAVHNTFSLREYCRVGKKAFLKLMKKELLALDPPGDWSLDLAQIVYDLYGLKIYAKTSMLIDHGCNADQIDRGSALELIVPVMAQVKDMNVKDVLRSEIKTATEKMQAVIGTPRSSNTQQAFNRRLLLSYLKTPINPMSLYQALKGIGGLSVMPVTTDYAMIARKKWFFFQGHLLLARYSSQKRTAPGSTDDLDNAVNYFKLDLDFDAESWETWYRLGQTYDAKIDEDVTWDAKELNNPESELVTYQKSAIHCYAMAVAAAVRNADESQMTTMKLSELYTDFANRVYASSRPPLGMGTFGLSDQKRFFNQGSRGTWQEKPFREMTDLSAWRYASELYRLALVTKPDSWWAWYMLGKSRWKMFKNEVLQRAGVTPKPQTWKNWYMVPRSEWQKDDPTEPFKYSFEQAIEAFSKAVENVPQKRDSRHPDKDPILEPHYKLVSVVYKLMQLGLMDLKQGVDVFAISPLIKKVAREESDNGRVYILRAMKALTHADKSNWHHRMVVRTASVHYDEDPLSDTNARAAKRELTQQIFTKTMSIQVWRPENERPGRHFVYKTSYTHFFTHLLHQLGEKAELDLLCKRIRRKQAEFLNHTWLWTEVSTAYVRLLRAQGEIPSEHADAVFRVNMSYEMFALNAGRLESWAHSQLSLGNPMLDLLREIIELKKLNGSYTPPTKIDELVDDTYAKIYQQMVPILIAKADEQENRERMRIDRMLMNDSPAPDERSSNEQGAATASRAKRIGRGDMRRRAEALVSKLTAPAMGAKGSSRRPPQSPVISRGGFPPRRQSIEDTDKPPGSSVPGSVHDSADDESELSEPPADDEEEEGASMMGLKPKPKEPMFPGLARREGTAESNLDGTEDEHYETAEEVGGGDDDDDDDKGDSEQADKQGGQGSNKAETEG